MHIKEFLRKMIAFREHNHRRSISAREKTITEWLLHLRDECVEAIEAINDPADNYEDACGELADVIGNAFSLLWSINGETNGQEMFADIIDAQEKKYRNRKPYLFNGYGKEQPKDAKQEQIIWNMAKAVENLDPNSTFDPVSMFDDNGNPKEPFLERFGMKSPAPSPLLFFGEQTISTISDKPDKQIIEGSAFDEQEDQFNNPLRLGTKGLTFDWRKVTANQSKQPSIHLFDKDIYDQKPFVPSPLLVVGEQPSNAPNFMIANMLADDEIKDRLDNSDLNALLKEARNKLSKKCLLSLKPGHPLVQVQKMQTKEEYETVSIKLPIPAEHIDLTFTCEDGPELCSEESAPIPEFTIVNTTTEEEIKEGLLRLDVTLDFPDHEDPDALWEEMGFPIKEETNKESPGHDVASKMIGRKSLDKPTEPGAYREGQSPSNEIYSIRNKELYVVQKHEREVEILSRHVPDVPVIPTADPNLKIVPLPGRFPDGPVTLGMLLDFLHDKYPDSNYHVDFVGGEDVPLMSRIRYDGYKEGGQS